MKRTAEVNVKLIGVDRSMNPKRSELSSAVRVFYRRRIENAPREVGLLSRVSDSPTSIAHTFSTSLVVLQFNGLSAQAQ